MAGFDLDHAVKVAAHFPRDSDAWDVAFLHDAIEDGLTTESRVREVLPDHIAEAIVTLTRIPYEKYHQSYIKRVAQNPLARLVKIADLEENLKRCGDDPKHASLRKRYEAARDLLS